MPEENGALGGEKGMPLKDGLFLGFCAVFILVTRMALRLHLHISGHSMFFTMFFLLLARGCVKRPYAASFSGLLAGLMAMVFGLGKGGLLIPIKFILPAVAVDVVALFIPGLFQSYLLVALTAAIASATKFAHTFIMDSLVGMERPIAVHHALLESAAAIGFGVAGSLLIPSVIRKLKAYGVI